MKKLLLLALFAASATFASAAQATSTVTFDQTNGVDPQIVYIVEHKLTQDGPWVAIAQGAASPIVYDANLSWGSYSIRVVVRVLPLETLPRDESLDTSVVASTYLYPGKPINPAVQTNRSKK
jgi:hypothetical protein